MLHGNHNPQIFGCYARIAVSTALTGLVFLSAFTGCTDRILRATETQTETQTETETETLSVYAEIYQSARESVVQITAVCHEDPETERISYGSGVILSEQGTVLTNRHVVAGSDEIRITLPNGTVADAVCIIADGDADLALLQIQQKTSSLHPVTVSDTGTPKPGEAIAVIGDPSHVGISLSCGYVSKSDTAFTVDGSDMTLVQLDVRVAGGSSGSGVFDIHGNLIGLIIGRDAGVQSGFAYCIPVSVITAFLNGAKGEV